MKAAAAAAAAVSLASCWVRAAQAAAATVTTTNGTLLGGQCATTNVTSYLGIPYARPPTGDLRFAPPQPYNQTYSARSATQPPPACLQFGAFLERGAQSEDCLFLNVWVPPSATASAAAKLPVKVWLYGGSNVNGGISNPTYDGCTASEHAIQVSINYRLGPLGFLAVGSLNVTGNQGIQDQLLGLRWVRDNIAAFGGDPSRVLLFGQSAGAFDAFVISSLPQAPSLISAVIMQSGAGLELQTASAVQPLAEAFVTGLGCNATTTTTTAPASRAARLSCLRNAPAAAIAQSFAANSGNLGLVVDGATIPQQPLDAGPRVPAVAGSTVDEGTLFALLTFGAAALANLTAAAYDGYLVATFGPALAARINQTYPVARYAASATGPGPAPAALRALSAVMTHSGFRCPTRRFLSRAARAGRVPVWTYSFAHAPSCAWYPPSILPPATLPLLGATHTADIPFVFAGTDSLPRPDGACNFTAAERALAAKMLGAWDAMAAKADPGSDWPQYHDNDDDAAAKNGSMGINMVGDGFEAGTVDYSMCDFWDQIAAETSAASGSGSVDQTSRGLAQSVLAMKKYLVMFASHVLWGRL